MQKISGFSKISRYGLYIPWFNILQYFMYNFKENHIKNHFCKVIYDN